MYKASHYNFYIPVPEYEKILLYNSFQNALFEIAAQEGAILQKQDEKGKVDPDAFAKDTWESLIREGFIVDSEKDEIGTVAKVKRCFLERNLKPNNSLGLVLLVTNGCNLGCVYCFEGRNKPLIKMGEDVFGKILEYVESKARQGLLNNLHISWYGGEPLLYPQLIREYSDKIMSLCEKYNIDYAANIITNGVNLTQENVALLEAAKVRSIQITLDGDRNVHDRKRPFLHSDKSSFDIILKNLHHLKGEPIEVSIRINTDREVFASVEGLLKKLIENEIWPHQKNFILYLAFTCGTHEYQDESLLSSPEFYDAVFKFRNMKFRLLTEWAVKNGQEPPKFKIKYPKITHNVCGTLNSVDSLVIDASGNISKCWEHINSPDVVVGTVHEGIDRVMQSTKYQTVISRFDIPEECKLCKTYPICEERFCPDHNFNVRTSRKCMWKYQLPIYMKNQYLMHKGHLDMIESFEAVEQRLTQHFSGVEI